MSENCAVKMQIQTYELFILFHRDSQEVEYFYFVAHIQLSKLPPSIKDLFTQTNINESEG